jgi:hypothetical protein
MKDSTVILWDGSRGSGKTLSAAYECSIRMVVDNELVFSNVPIAFDFDFEDGKPPVHYESKPLSIDALLICEKEVVDATIFWDEMALWAFSRSHGAVFNKLITLVLTLLRKRRLSLVITSQSAKMLDSNVRFQFDAICSCIDLSFKYPNLKRGSQIGQSWKDVSGVFTGTRFDDYPKTYPQVLNGEVVWGIYDTLKEFDVLDAQSKYKLNMGTKILTRDGIDTAQSPTDNQEIIDILTALPDTRYNSGDFMQILKSVGIETNIRAIGHISKQAGWNRKRLSHGGWVYERESEAA